MTKLVTPDQVEIVVRGLLGAIDVDGGPTDEQLSILSAVTHHVWGRGDLLLADLTPLGPAETGRILAGTPAARRFHYLLFVLEICRHPLTAAQVDRVESYASALSVDGMGLEMTRDLVRDGVERARADAVRFQEGLAVADAEPTFRDAQERGDFADPRLLAALDHFATLPDGTLGREFLAFHERFGLETPGQTPSDHVYLFFSHDMNHVIAGYDPVAAGEMALGAFQMGMADTDVSWMLCLNNLAIHEAGILQFGDIAPKDQTLARPGVAETFAIALHRGTQCTGDFATADHLALADRPLEEVRARFGVPPLPVT